MVINCTIYTLFCDVTCNLPIIQKCHSSEGKLLVMTIHIQLLLQTKSDLDSSIAYIIMTLVLKLCSSTINNSVLKYDKLFSICQPVILGQNITNKLENYKQVGSNTIYCQEYSGNFWLSVLFSTDI